MLKDGGLSQEEKIMITSSDGTVLLSCPLTASMDIDVAGYEGSAVVKIEDLEDMKQVDEDDVCVNQMLSEVGSGDNVIRASHTTLHSLLSTPVCSTSGNLVSREGIQVITIPTSQELMCLSGDMMDRVVHMVPTSGFRGFGKYIGLIAISDSNLITQTKEEVSDGFAGLEMLQAAEASDLNQISADNMEAILMPPPPVPQDLPSNCPAWAMRLKKCEKIGDFFRGYVENEIDLDLILTLHKQQTNSFWGTRQSPSPAKASTRLMWKSQYVPFDGIPFVNAGSRAVVMECQHGPRRKGTLGKRGANAASEFKQTCPARIYIKKVRKFPSYAVDLNMDKKNIRVAMDKAFHELREQGLETWGEERFYVQLPTEKAHDYHDDIKGGVKTEMAVTVIEETSIDREHQHHFPPVAQDKEGSDTRVHPAVLEKIRQLVSSGETKIYAIRRQLRRFVLRDLCQGSGQVPERHDLTMFPTVNDLKNHIHQALKDIESGVLLYNPLLVNQEDESSTEEKEATRDILKSEVSTFWPPPGLAASTPIPETVTVTLTQNPEEEGHHIISRIETHLSDGTTQVSTTLTPETAHILSQLHPGLFPADSLLQLENLQVHLSSSQTLSQPVDMLNASQGTAPPGSTRSDLELSMGETSHLMHPAHITGIVDMDTTHSISEMMESEVASSMLVSSDHPHSLPTIQLNPSSTQTITQLINSDTANLASIVTSDSGHHITSLVIPTSGLSVLSAVDTTGLSEIISVSHQDAIALVSGGSLHSMDLVSAEGVGLEGDEVCDQMIHKSPDLDDHEDREDKLTDDKLVLHITSDQKLGMTRLESRVSDL